MDQQLIHDWNEQADTAAEPPKVLMLDDETLRDGLQSPSVVDPPIKDKVRILHLMDELGIDTADVGLPGAGPRAEADVEALCREIARNLEREIAYPGQIKVSVVRETRAVTFAV